MPLYRRLPKRGFTAPNAKRYAVVNLGLIEKFIAAGKLDISVELTELLHSPSVLKAAAKNQLGFDQVQWSEHHFRQRIEERMSSKAAQLSRSDRRCDILILHTDEPWLSPSAVEQWLARKPLQSEPRFGAAYLLMTYVPGWSDHWPVFRLWGPAI